MALISYKLSYGPRIVRVPDESVSNLNIAEDTIIRTSVETLGIRGCTARYEGAWVWSLWMENACVAHVSIPKFQKGA